MAVAYITEYERLAREEFGTTEIQTPLEPPLAEQIVAIGSSSLTSNVLNTRTRLVRFHTDAICHIAVGKDPIANASKRRFAAGSTEFIGIPADGTEYKIAVITGS